MESTNTDVVSDAEALAQKLASRKIRVNVFIPVAVEVTVTASNHLAAIRRAREVALVELQSLIKYYEAFQYADDLPTGYVVEDTDLSQSYYLRDGKTRWMNKAGCDVCGSPKGVNNW